MELNKKLRSYIIVWFIRMPKEQWALLRAIVKEADERGPEVYFEKL